jgi:hypothetical protein
LIASLLFYVIGLHFKLWLISGLRNRCAKILLL